MTDQQRERPSHEDKPDLPEPWGLIGFFIGFALAAVYFRIVIAVVPNELFPLHMVLMVPMVYLFLGVPALFEQYYWRRYDV